MKKLFLITAVLMAALSFTSCKEDEPTPMLWEFSDYDANAISAVFAPEFYTQVQITAKPDYTGDITLKCTNFREVDFLSWETENVIVSKECGFTITKEGATTVKISFSSVDLPGNSQELCQFISITGSNGKESGSTNIAIIRTNDPK